MVICCMEKQASGVFADSDHQVGPKEQEESWNSQTSPRLQGFGVLGFRALWLPGHTLLRLLAKTTGSVRSFHFQFPPAQTEAANLFLEIQDRAWGVRGVGFGVLGFFVFFFFFGGGGGGRGGFVGFLLSVFLLF